MKKFLSKVVLTFLIITIVFSFSACGGGGVTENNITDSSVNSASLSEWVVTKAAGCESEGVETLVNKTDETRFIAAFGHEWDEWEITTEPTCLVAGVETRTCNDCGNIDVQPVAALGHDWDEWDIMTAPTCTKAGIEIMVCKHDENHTDIRSFSAVGHDWSAWVVKTAPTCEIDGVETRLCRNDNVHTETRTIKELEHDWSHWVTTIPATETTDGEEMRVCRSNKNHIETATIHRTGTEGLKYTLINGDTAYEVSKGTANSNERIIIPAFYNGLPVTSIGNSAFSYCSNLTDIIFSKNLTDFGSRMFTGSSKLKSIIVDSENTIFRSEENCVIRISDDTLIVGCASSVVPNGVKRIDGYAFADSKITTIFFPDCLEYIGAYSFARCFDLTEISIPASVTTIDDYAFFGCTGIIQIMFSEGLKSIGNYAFVGQFNIENLSLPKSLETLGRYNFMNSRSLKSITLPKNLSFIGIHAFRNSGIETIIMLNSAVEFEAIAFDGCTNLQTIYYSGTANQFEEVLANKFRKTINQILFYSETENFDGQHWRYVDGVPTVWA